MRIVGHMKRSESRMGCGVGSALGTGLGSERGSGLGCRLGFGPGSRLGSQLGSGIGSRACTCPKYRCFCVWGGEASQKLLFLGRCAHKNTAVYIGACMPSYPKNLVFLGGRGACASRNSLFLGGRARKHRKSLFLGGRKKKNSRLWGGGGVACICAQKKPLFLWTGLLTGLLTGLWTGLWTALCTWLWTGLWAGLWTRDKQLDLQTDGQGFKPGAHSIFCHGPQGPLCDRSPWVHAHSLCLTPMPRPCRSLLGCPQKSQYSYSANDQIFPNGGIERPSRVLRKSGAGAQDVSCDLLVHEYHKSPPFLTYLCSPRPLCSHSSSS